MKRLIKKITTEKYDSGVLVSRVIEEIYEDGECACTKIKPTSPFPSWSFSANDVTIPLSRKKEKETLIL